MTMDSEFGNETTHWVVFGIGLVVGVFLCSAFIALFHPMNLCAEQEVYDPHIDRCIVKH